MLVPSILVVTYTSCQIVSPHLDPSESSTIHVASRKRYVSHGMYSRPSSGVPTAYTVQPTEIRKGQNLEILTFNTHGALKFVN
jgi:hypothetical protein